MKASTTPPGPVRREMREWGPVSRPCRGGAPCRCVPAGGCLGGRERSAARTEGVRAGRGRRPVRRGPSVWAARSTRALPPGRRPAVPGPVAGPVQEAALDEVPAERADVVVDGPQRLVDIALAVVAVRLEEGAGEVGEELLAAGGPAGDCGEPAADEEIPDTASGPGSGRCRSCRSCPEGTSGPPARQPVCAVRPWPAAASGMTRGAHPPAADAPPWAGVGSAERPLLVGGAAAVPDLQPGAVGRAVARWRPGTCWPAG